MYSAYIVFVSHYNDLNKDLEQLQLKINEELNKELSIELRSGEYVFKDTGEGGLWEIDTPNFIITVEFTEDYLSITGMMPVVKKHNNVVILDDVNVAILAGLIQDVAMTRCPKESSSEVNNFKDGLYITGEHSLNRMTHGGNKRSNKGDCSNE